MQAEHTHSPTPQPGVVGRSRNPSPNPHTHSVHPRPGVAWCKRSTHTAQLPRQEWRGAAEIDPKHTHPHRAPVARSGWVQAEHAHSRTPQPGVAECSRNPSQNTHTHTAHLWPGVAGCKRSKHTAQQPSQEWRGAAETRAQTHTPTPRIRGQDRLGASRAHTQPNTPARSGGAQPKPEPKHTHRHRAPLARSGWVQAEHTHSPTAQPTVAGRSRNPSPNTHIHTAHPWPGVAGCKRSTHTAQDPSQEWRGEPKTEPKHTHPHRAPWPGVAGCERSSHTAQHPSQEWRGAAETRAQTHTSTLRTRARSGQVQAEQTHSPTPQPGVAGRSRNPSPNTHTHSAHPCQEWLGARTAHTQADTDPNTRGKGAGRSRNPNPTTTQTQTQAPRNSRKPRVHSPGTEAARAMQVTRPNETRRPGVRLHPKACAACGLEAERATPKHLGTPVPRTCMHALGTGYARKSGEPIGFRPKEGTCASTGAHPPGMTSSHADGDQPSGCCPGPLCSGPPVRSSGK